jgi:hypothetical protein
VELYLLSPIRLFGVVLKDSDNMTFTSDTLSLLAHTLLSPVPSYEGQDERGGHVEDLCIDEGYIMKMHAKGSEGKVLPGRVSIF